MDERLEFYLKRHKDGGCADLKLSRRNCYRIKHLKRSSRLLKKLEQRGALKLQRNHIELKIKHL
jgi:CRP/FNR family transcriptional regulator